MINSPIYKKLLDHHNELQNCKLVDLFSKDKNRVESFSLDYNGFYYDFSKNKVNRDTISLLVELAKDAKLSAKIDQMFDGHKINITENRSVLHTLLRDKNSSNSLMKDIDSVLIRMRDFSQNLHNGIHLGCTGKKITDIVNIGIGGSDLGPSLVCDALKPYRVSKDLNVHFVSSVDGYQIFDTLSELDHQTTLFVIASKTFTTQETITNATTARSWFLENSGGNLEGIKSHFVAVSTNKDGVEKFGIDPNNMFEFWDFVGGRYSLWSAIGLSIILYIGYDNFAKLLAGAYDMDLHFKNTHDYTQNIPIILALIGIWNVNFNNYSSLVISPYNTRLSKFPHYVQQLEMESNGKSVDIHGKKIANYKTCPIIWGDSGINGQHAYYQLLHQGTSIVPMDIIIAKSKQFSNKIHQDILFSNAIAQAQAFMCGKSINQANQELLKSGLDESEAAKLAPHKEFDGDRPTNMIVLPEISPYYLGMLIALYEHKTFVQGIIWQVNSFDQWGVELGKQLAKTILNDITIKELGTYDQSTTKLVEIAMGL